MAILTNYEDNGDGTYKIVIDKARLTQDEILMLDNGFILPVEFEVVDERKLSVKQRRKIFALLNDIYLYTGQPTEDLRMMFQLYTEVMYGYDTISLRNCSMTVAKNLIEVILEWTFLYDIPLHHKTAELLKEDERFIYLSTINKQCVICGKPHSDLAHREAVGRGRDRRSINHYDHTVLALCRSHHNEQHNIGTEAFDKKYFLTNAWIKVDDRLNKMLKGRA